MAVATSDFPDNTGGRWHRATKQSIAFDSDAICEDVELQGQRASIEGSAGGGEGCYKITALDRASRALRGPPRGIRLAMLLKHLLAALDEAGQQQNFFGRVESSAGVAILHSSCEGLRSSEIGQTLNFRT